MAASAAGHNCYMPQLSGGIAAPFEHLPAAYRPAADTRTNKNTDQVAHSLGGPIEPLPVCSGAYIVHNNNGQSNTFFQFVSQRDITPTQVRGKLDTAGRRFHLTCHTNAEGNRILWSLHHAIFYTCLNIGDDRSRTLLRICRIALRKDDMPFIIHQRGLYLGTAQ